MMMIYWRARASSSLIPLLISWNGFLNIYNLPFLFNLTSLSLLLSHLKWSLPPSHIIIYINLCLFSRMSFLFVVVERENWERFEMNKVDLGRMWGRTAARTWQSLSRTRRRRSRTSNIFVQIEREIGETNYKNI